MQPYTEKQEIAFLKNSLCIKGRSAESLSLTHTHKHAHEQTNQRTHINMQSGIFRPVWWRKVEEVEGGSGGAAAQTCREGGSEGLQPADDSSPTHKQAEKH